MALTREKMPKDSKCLDSFDLFYHYFRIWKQCILSYFTLQGRVVQYGWDTCISELTERSIQ